MEKVEIFIPVGGRLGNQLFYYSFGRWLMEEYRKRNIETELILDFSNVIKHGKKYIYENNGWENSLSLFNTIEFKSYENNRVTYREGSIKQKIISLIITISLHINYEKTITKIKKNFSNLCEIGLIYAFADTPIDEYIFSTKNRKIFVRRVPETSRYQNMIRNKLISEIEPIQPKKSKNYDLYNIIESTNSVCVSIRRGDYITNPDVAAEFSTCNKDYFSKAIAIMENKILNPVFIFFSDDIEWCIKEFGSISNNIYFESGDDSLDEKLRLMYSCKHFIISNSTFSWWAQWLGKNEDKIVVSPEKWYKDKEDTLVEDSFINIKV